MIFPNDFTDWLGVIVVVISLSVVLLIALLVAG